MPDPGGKMDRWKDLQLTPPDYPEEKCSESLKDQLSSQSPNFNHQFTLAKLGAFLPAWIRQPAKEIRFASHHMATRLPLNCLC
jgi:hypothetical protein